MYILSNGDEKILIYDSDGNFCGDIPLPFVATAIAKAGDYFFLHTRGSISGERFGIHVINEKGEIVNKYYEFDELSFPHNQQQMLWKLNDTIYAEFYHDYNVYQMTDEYFGAYAAFDFGKDNIAQEFRSLSNYTHNSQISDYLRKNNYRPPRGLDYVLVSSDFMIVQFTSFFLKRTFIWNKRNSRIVDKPISSSEKYPVSQGIDFHAISGNKLYSLVPAHQIIKARDGGYGSFPEELRSLKPEDNPVLIIYTLKE